ncbi:hypothetical protein IRJ41_004589 [Triplophysa rosa]|uniref:Uncharacterized protein n=1 Tax=Triplophysa rosa TaxID=992332 RepID=A0A9W7T7B4_TRIRA|nr:hypothetical protein IRJ41_004589 [Triplophysa rosa]
MFVDDEIRKAFYNTRRSAVFDITGRREGGLSTRQSHGEITNEEIESEISDIKNITPRASAGDWQLDRLDFPVVNALSCRLTVTMMLACQNHMEKQRLDFYRACQAQCASVGRVSLRRQILKRIPNYTLRRFIDLLKQVLYVRTMRLRTISSGEIMSSVFIKRKSHPRVIARLINDSRTANWFITKIFSDPDWMLQEPNDQMFGGNPTFAVLPFMLNMIEILALENSTEMFFKCLHFISSQNVEINTDCHRVKSSFVLRTFDVRRAKLFTFCRSSVRPAGRLKWKSGRKACSGREKEGRRFE